ncbi:hypothetical protein V8C42DRAFT_358960 [Trichoderma barbatum]
MASTTSPSPDSAKPSAIPPIKPGLWTWRCHECKRWYPLSCTHRCLHCSHVLCFAHKGTPNEAKTCKTAFDFTGWQIYNNWRRDVQEYKASCEESRARSPAEATESAAAKADTAKSSKTDNTLIFVKMMHNGTYDCTVHCEFPSQCFRMLNGLLRGPVSKPSAVTSSQAPPPKPKPKPKELIRSRKRKARRHHTFQKKPSRLYQSWQPEGDS